jgi:hypothetical protein
MYRCTLERHSFRYIRIEDFLQKTSLKKQLRLLLSWFSDKIRLPHI